MEESRPWHHLFGLSWTDFFRGTPVTVEPEKDLSHKRQLLDLAIVLPQGNAPRLRRLPDGFEELGRHNLVTFKSYQEAMTSWALNELVCHYVNYRKQVSPSMQNLLPENDFRRFAVCVRFPDNLAQQTELHPIQQGVYEVRHFADRLRVIVVHELPCQEHNAMLLLFSAKQDLIEYGARHYQPHSLETSTLLLNLIARYRQEGIPMPETLEEFAKRAKTELLKNMPPEERLEGLSPEERLEGLSSEERLRGLPPEERLRGLSPEERLRGLSPEEREVLARLLQGNANQPPPS
jgi:hypothetical protein